MPPNLITIGVESYIVVTTMKTIPVKLVDLSRFQDNPDTPYKPTLEKLKAAGFQGFYCRVGYGLLEDALFKYYWQIGKGVLPRGGYWYLDYYSWMKTGMTPAAWGYEQADQCHDFMGGDFGELPLALDCEPGASVKITALPLPGTVSVKQYNECARAFHDRWYQLTGKHVLLYCSKGFLPTFYSWAKSLDWWCAWYNRSITKADVIAEYVKLGFTGTVRMWQFASDGDVNDDGIADGIVLGMESSTLDLNGYLGKTGSIEEFSSWAGQETPAPIPVDPPTPPAPIDGKTFTVICPSGLNVRDVPIGIPVSDVIGWKAPNTVITAEKVVTVGSDIWAVVSQFQVCAIKYNGIEYMKVKT